MRLDDIRNTIENSTDADWHHIGCWGAGAGPSFHDKWERWGTLGGGELDKWALDLDSHGNTLVFRENVALTISWGITVSKDMTPDWNEVFADSRPVDYQVGDVFWNGVLVDRHYLTAVDGGRVILPLPKPIFEERNGKTVAVRHEVPAYHRAFARLVHNAEPGENFDRYYEDAGFTTVDNPS
ncbi:hypothetical protein ACFRSX_29745 [Streptomyces goshikiensis]|uniref:hypothetical protein n=1 Tax=Streptomyces TaxID=1883 RepID=UPI000C27BF0F|nr:hypothetical protein [Streptomyces sp. CB02120-2]PJN17333.1 hypothetical protein CG724_16910 [Streptomyces sp. CB02120-2]